MVIFVVRKRSTYHNLLQPLLPPHLSFLPHSFFPPLLLYLHRSTPKWVMCVWWRRSKNNHVEGWHNKINKNGGKSHPNIYEVVEPFKTEQAATEVTLWQLEPGGTFAGTRKAYRCKEFKNDWEKIKEKFENNDYSLDQYISAVSNWVRFRS